MAGNMHGRIAALTVAGAAILGGLWRRWLGGWLSGPRGVKITVAVLLGMAIILILQPWSLTLLWQAAVISVIMAAGWTPGHGSYMDMGTMNRPDNEAVRFIVKPIANVFGFEDMTQPYDVLGMSIRYGLVTLIAAGAMLALGFGGWFILAPFGFLAGPLYLASLKLGFKHFTEPGEIAIGAALYSGMAAAFLI